jgi:type III pantothenate kinase
MTCDAVTSDGRHLGGLIIPGRLLQEQALLQGTAAVNVERAKAPKVMWGQETVACVQSGILQAQLALIERCVRQLLEYGEKAVSVVLTGGDAVNLVPHLTLPVQHEPDLVFKGMLHIMMEQRV